MYFCLISSKGPWLNWEFTPSVLWTRRAAQSSPTPLQLNPRTTYWQPFPRLFLALVVHAMLCAERALNCYQLKLCWKTIFPVSKIQGFTTPQVEDDFPYISIFPKIHPRQVGKKGLTGRSSTSCDMGGSGARVERNLECSLVTRTPNMGV